MLPSRCVRCIINIMSLYRSYRRNNGSHCWWFITIASYRIISAVQKLEVWTGARQSIVESRLQGNTIAWKRSRKQLSKANSSKYTIHKHPSIHPSIHSYVHTCIQHTYIRKNKHTNKLAPILFIKNPKHIILNIAIEQIAKEHTLLETVTTSTTTKLNVKQFVHRLQHPLQQQ